MIAIARRVLPDDERIDWLRLSRAAHVGPITFFALLSRFGSATRAIDELPRLAARSGRAKPVAIPSANDIRREIDKAAKLGVRHLASCEPAYPEALAVIEDAPPVIAAGRDLSLFERPCVAIVGARNASLNGKRIAARLAADLGEAGFVVVSGLARGIDTEAHKVALAHGTIAVVAGGVDVVYPPENSALQARIFDSGCVISETPLGTEPMARHFPRRNRIISGIVPGVIVVEAAKHSGSLITARDGLGTRPRGFRCPGLTARPAIAGRQRLDP